MREVEVEQFPIGPRRSFATTVTIPTPSRCSQIAGPVLRTRTCTAGPAGGLGVILAASSRRRLLIGFWSACSGARGWSSVGLPFTASRPMCSATSSNSMRNSPAGRVGSSPTTSMSATGAIGVSRSPTSRSMKSKSIRCPWTKRFTLMTTMPTLSLCSQSRFRCSGTGRAPDHRRAGSTSIDACRASASQTLDRHLTGVPQPEESTVREERQRKHAGAARRDRAPLRTQPRSRTRESGVHPRPRRNRRRQPALAGLRGNFVHEDVTLDDPEAAHLCLRARRDE